MHACPCCRNTGEIRKAFYPPLSLRVEAVYRVVAPADPPIAHRVPCPECRPRAFEESCRQVYEQEDSLHEKWCRVRQDKRRYGRPGTICTCPRGRRADR